MTKDVILYDYFRSTAAYRVRIALNYKGLAYTSIPVHLVKDGGEQHFPDYQRINPQELVPSLLINDLSLTQSLAIIEYLEDMHPKPLLLPKDSAEKAYVRSLALTIACEIHPLNNLRVLQYLQKKLDVSDEQKQQWYFHWLELGFSSLEARIAPTYEGDGYCIGKSLTLADVCLIPQIYNAHRFDFLMEAYPTLSHINDHCLSLDFIDQATPAKVQEMFAE